MANQLLRVSLSARTDRSSNNRIVHEPLTYFHRGRPLASVTPTASHPFPSVAVRGRRKKKKESTISPEHGDH